METFDEISSGELHVKKEKFSFGIIYDNLENEFSRNRTSPNGTCIEKVILTEIQNVEKAEKLLFAVESLGLVLLILAALSTFYDFVTRKSEKRLELFLSFSLRKNVPNMLNVNVSKDAIMCLHGIRSLSTFCIMFLHMYAFRFLTPFYADKKEISDMIKPSVSSLSMTVDSFFVISAALSTKIMLKELDQ